MNSLAKRCGFQYPDAAEHCRPVKGTIHMRAIIQRVHCAEIIIDGKETRKIGPGLVVFLGVMKGDACQQADFLAEKVFGLRIFTDENDKMNLSLADVGGELLVVSNFTLGTDCRKGRRPSFDLAAPSRSGGAALSPLCGAGKGAGRQIGTDRRVRRPYGRPGQ